MITIIDTQLYTVPETAEYFNVSDETVINWIKSEKLQATKPGRKYMIYGHSIIALKNGQPGTTQALTIVPEVPKELTEAEKQKQAEDTGRRLEALKYIDDKTLEAQTYEAETRANAAKLAAKQSQDALDEAEKEHIKALAESEVKHKRALYELDRFITLEKLIAGNEEKQAYLNEETKKTENYNISISLQKDKLKNRVDNIYDTVKRSFNSLIKQYNNLEGISDNEKKYIVECLQNALKYISKLEDV